VFIAREGIGGNHSKNVLKEDRRSTKTFEPTISWKKAASERKKLDDQGKNLQDDYKSARIFKPTICWKRPQALQDHTKRLL